MNEIKKGAVKTEPCVTPPMSLHSKSLPGGDSAPGPMSFSKNKSGDNGSSNRPAGYRADEVMRGVGG